MGEVLVSISCITYNHAKYIRQCLDGFLMQKSHFRYEVLIHDDASNDGTSEIIREYEKLYPDIIKPIIQKENQFSKGKRGFNATYNFSRAIGKYIAMCEGDDYWTDPLKLQKQVDYLEKNPDCSLCFHATLFENQLEPERSYVHRPSKISKDEKFTIRDAILGGGAFMSTNSMVFKAEYARQRPDWMEISPVGDLPLMLLLASKGNIGYINKVMAAYRVNAIGSWSNTMKESKNKEQHQKRIVQTFIKFDEWTNYKYHSVIRRKLIKNRINFLKYRVLRLFSNTKKSL